MLSELHRRYDRMREPWRELLGLAVLGVLVLCMSQPWSGPVCLAGIFAAVVLLASRVRYLEGS